jgi:hypothetical protein
MWLRVRQPPKRSWSGRWELLVVPDGPAEFVSGVVHDRRRPKGTAAPGYVKTVADDELEMNQPNRCGDQPGRPPGAGSGPCSTARASPRCLSRAGGPNRHRWDGLPPQPPQLGLPESEVRMECNNEGPPSRGYSELADRRDLALPRMVSGRQVLDRVRPVTRATH